MEFEAIPRLYYGRHVNSCALPNGLRYPLLWRITLDFETLGWRLAATFKESGGRCVSLPAQPSGSARAIRTFSIGGFGDTSTFVFKISISLRVPICSLKPIIFPSDMR